MNNIVNRIHGIRRHRTPMHMPQSTAMMGRRRLCTALTLSACNVPKDTNTRVYVHAVEKDLGRAGEVSTDDLARPRKVAINEVPKSREDIPTSEAHRMAALEAAGLDAFPT